MGRGKVLAAQAVIHNLPLAPTDIMRGDRPVYILAEPLTVQGVTVAKGFLTDLVSAPRWTRKWLPLAKMARAALLHDWLCNMSPIGKLKANAIFRRQMKADGVSFAGRWAIWAYVSRPFAPRVRWHQPYLD